MAGPKPARKMGDFGSLIHSNTLLELTLLSYPGTGVGKFSNGDNYFGIRVHDGSASSPRVPGTVHCSVHVVYLSFAQMINKKSLLSDHIDRANTTIVLKYIVLRVLQYATWHTQYETSCYASPRA